MESTDAGIAIGSRFEIFRFDERVEFLIISIEYIRYHNFTSVVIDQ